MPGPYDPDVYDLTTAESLLGDKEWYTRKAQEYGGSVLELGAGTGRITIPIAQAGVTIVGVDADQGMLAKLRRKLSQQPANVQKRVTIAEADMRRLELGQTFRFAIIPFRAFLHNLTTDDQLACLERVRAHLEPGGRLAFNVFHPSLEYMAQHTGPLAGVWRWVSTSALPDGGHILRSEATRYDTVRRRVQSRIRYEHFDTSGNLVRTFLHHLELAYLYPSDIHQLLERSGFEGVEISGDFTGRPFERDTDELVVEAKRA